MLTFSISLSPVQVARIMTFFTLLMLLPFLSPELSYVYNDTSDCMKQGLKPVLTNLYSYLLLGDWMQYDAMIKLAICGFSIFFIRMRRDLPKQVLLLVAAQGNMLTLYWIFQFGWYIAAGVMFWDHVDYTNEAKCDGSLSAFMQANLICNYIFVPIGIAISRIRPTFDIEELVNKKTTRAQTQLTKREQM